MTVSDHPQPARPRISFVFAAAFFLFLTGQTLLFGQTDATRPFDVAEGTAEVSFRQFSEQAGIQFIYSTEKIRGVRTKAVKDRLTPRQALDRMLDGTPLVAVYDNQTGALTVDRTQVASPDDTQKKSPVETAAPSSGAVMVDEVIVLSPFEVRDRQSDSYLEESTLAGNRLNMRLRDTGSAISVVNAQMMQDIAATNSETLLQYTTNSEVGNIYGNMANVGSGQVLDERNNFLNPNANTRIRGLGAADNTIDFFLSDIPWDSYNTGRVDMQRGPNAILFGLGSPAGIINAGTNTADVQKTKGKIEARFARFGSVRGSLDYNQVLIPKELAVRIDLLHNHEKYQQEPAFQKDRRFFGALRYEPGFLNKGSAKTIFRANFEKGKVTMRRPRVLPPGDSITQWYNTGQSPGFTSTGAPMMYNNMNKMGFNQIGLMNNNISAIGDPSRGNFPATYPNGTPNPYFQPWLGGQFAANYFGNPLAIYEDGSGNPRYFQLTPSTPNGINSSGAIDGNVGGLPSGTTASSITTYRDWTRKTNQPGAFFGFPKNLILTDPTIFDFYNNLIDGPNKKEWQNFERYNINLAQVFFDGNAGFELAHDQQHYDNGQLVIIGDRAATLYVDVMQTLADGSTNPNFGRPFIGDTLANNAVNSIDRSSDRATIFVKYPFEKRHPASLVARILGTHTLTGYYNHDRRTQDSRNFARFGVDRAYRDLIAGTAGTSNFNDNNRLIFPAIYLGPSLYDRSSASGARIPRATHEIQAPTGLIRVFDSTWAPAAGVNPADPWQNTIYPVGNTLRNSTQSENPANYRGWVSAPLNVLDSERGNRDALTRFARLDQVTLESAAAVYNAALFKGAVVGMYGFREDYVRTNTFTGVRLPNGGPIDLSSTNYRLGSRPTKTDHVQAHSWSLVAHLTELLPKNPLPLDISVFYNTSENFQPSGRRVGMFGEDLGPPQGDTRDMGIMLATKDRNYSLRVNKYKSVLSNSNSTSGFGNTFFMRQLFTTYQPLRNVYQYRIDGGVFDLSGTQGNDPTRWTWQPRPGQTVGDAATEQAASIAAWDAMVASIPPQFFKAFGFDFSRIQRYDDATEPSGLSLTEDSVSEGYEAELFASPVRGLRLTFNVSKSEAVRTNQGAPSWIQMISIINNALNTTAAGLMRDSSQAGSGTALTNWNSNFNAPWQTVKQQEGGPVPELRKWRANAIVNYEFNRTFMKGFNIGAGYRWQDKVVIGWEPVYLDVNGNPAANPQVARVGKLNFDKPYYGPAESDVDLWIGYKLKLKNNMTFRTQLNVRNVGRGDYLIPITTQPDGTPAGVRIGPTQVWSLTNTLEF